VAAPSDLIAVGPPPLTRLAADCSLDLIDFIVAAVRGNDLIDVNETMRETWRNYLATYYPMLAPVDRYWFVSAPFVLSNIQAAWPQLPEPSREVYRQSWAAELPRMLQFVDPVLRATHQEAPQQSVAHLVDNVLRQQQQTGAETADPQLQAQKEFFNHQMNSITLQRFSNVMATNTIDLMHAMNPR
jgi:hypothetical protein